MQSNTNQNQICKKIERLLIEDGIEGLSPEKEKQVQQHLSACVGCRHLQQTLNHMHRACRIAEEAALKPDPAIRSQLLQHLAKKSKARTLFWVDFQATFQRVRDYRFSIYQMGLTLAVLLLVVLGIQQLSFEERTSMSMEIPNNIETVLADSNMINNALQIIRHHNGGRNVKEDSAVTKFIKTTM